MNYLWVSKLGQVGELPWASNISGSLAQRASWNSHIFWAMKPDKYFLKLQFTIISFLVKLNRLINYEQLSGYYKHIVLPIHVILRGLTLQTISVSNEWRILWKCYYMYDQIFTCWFFRCITQNSIKKFKTPFTLCKYLH